MYKSNIRNKKARAERFEKKRELIFPEEGQEFAFVQELMGNGRIKVMCGDEKVRVGRIRGSMRKSKHKVIINRGDIVLVSKRDYEDDKVDVIHKYNPEETNKLYVRKELPQHIEKLYQNRDESSYASNNNEENYVIFANEENDEKSDSSLDLADI